MKTLRIGLFAGITPCLSLPRLYGETNGVDIGYVPPIVDLNPYYMKKVTWREMASMKLAESGYNVMFDRFGPFSEFEWLWRSQSSGRSLLDDYNGLGKSATKTMLTYTLREAAIGEYLPERSSRAQIFIAGSIGNTAEEELSSQRSTYSASETAWWYDGHTPYGIRPWSTSPYAYYRLRIGVHHIPMFLAETRIRYSIFSSRHEMIEENLSFPLLHGWSFNIAGAVHPSSLKRYDMDDRFSYSVQLIRSLGRHPSNGAFSLGAYRNARTTIVTLGFFVPW